MRACVRASERDLSACAFHSFVPKSDLRILRDAKYKSENAEPKKERKTVVPPVQSEAFWKPSDDIFSFEPTSDLRILKNAKYKSENAKPKKEKKNVVPPVQSGEFSKPFDDIFTVLSLRATSES